MKEALKEMKTRLVIFAISMLVVLLASAPGLAEQQTYKVLKGDSLYKIGKMFSMTPEALKELNGLRNDHIQVGQALKVSSSSSAVQSSAKTAADTGNSPGQPQSPQARQAQNETQTYKVRNGDTLSGIARSFNVSLKDLTAANNIRNNNTLKIGEVLTIPGGNKTVVATPQAVTTAEDATSAPAAAIQRVANLPELKPAQSEGELNTRDRLVEAGFNLLGVRYRFGGTSEKTGLDCSALVKNLFEKFNLSLPRSSRDQYKQGEKVAKEDLQKGDLVFFSSGGKTPTHVGIYIGDNQFLHAASRAKKVIVSDLGKTWYDLRYLGARRIMELWWEEPKISLDNPSFEWAHQLLDSWEDSQIPLNDALPAEFTVSIQKHDVPHEELAASIVPD